MTVLCYSVYHRCRNLLTMVRLNTNELVTCRWSRVRWASCNEIPEWSCTFMNGIYTYCQLVANYNKSAFPEKSLFSHLVLFNFFYLYANNSMEQRNNDVESTLGNISHEENKTISILAIILTFTRNYLIAELLKLWSFFLTRMATGDYL